MIGVKLSNGKTVNIDTDDPQAAVAAGRKIDAEEAASQDAKRYVGSTPAPVAHAGRSVSLGLSSHLNAATGALNTGISRMMGRDPGYGMGDAYNAIVREENAAEGRYADSQPDKGVFSSLAWGALMPGNKAIFDLVKKGGAGLLGMAARSAPVAGALGAVGGGLAADPGETLAGAARGAKIGAAVGAAAPYVGAGVGAAAERVAAPVARTVVRAANRATGGQMLNPRQEAGKRLAESLRLDGLNADQIRAGINAWLRDGNEAPALLDVAGRNTTRLLRAAGSKNETEAQNAAIGYRDSTRSNMIPRARRATQALTPGETRSPTQYGEHLREQQRSQATADYGPVRNIIVAPSDRLHLALSGEPGRAALAQARRGAAYNQDAAAVRELDELSAALESGDRIPPIGAGVLDHIQRAFGEIGEGLSSPMQPSSSRYAGRGAFMRGEQVDSELAGVPELGPARANFRGYQAQRDAVELGENALGESRLGVDYADELENLSQRNPEMADEVRRAAGVGVRGDYMRRLGASRENRAGLLDDLSQPSDAALVQDTTFGPEAGGRYRRVLGRETQRFRRANDIANDTNSQTAGRLGDEARDIKAPPSINPVNAALFLINKARNASTMTDAERLALIEMGTGSVTDVPPALLPLLKAAAARVQASAGATAGVAAPVAAVAGRRQ